MIRWRLATIAVLLACVLARPAAQQDIGELDLLLEKLGRYLDAYEGQLAGVVADERYEQQQITVFRRNRVVSENVEDRKLDCEMTFLLGPDEPRWVGVRDVRRVDGHPVHSNAMRLDDLVQSRDQRRRAEDAAKIVGRAADTTSAARERSICQPRRSRSSASINTRASSSSCAAATRSTAPPPRNSTSRSSTSRR